jgi:hypothetical protein
MPEQTSPSKAIDFGTRWHEMRLEDNRRRFNDGDKRALFRAIHYCGQNRLILPEWVHLAFTEAAERWFEFEVKTLDEAFGVTYPKGMHFDKKRRFQQIAPKIYQRIREEHTEGRSIDESLFEEIGHEFFVEKTTASKAYYAMRRHYGIRP